MYLILRGETIENPYIYVNMDRVVAILKNGRGSELRIDLNFSICVGESPQEIYRQIRKEQEQS